MNSITPKHHLGKTVFTVLFFVFIYANINAENSFPNDSKELRRYRVETLDDSMPFRYTAEVDSFIHLFLNKRRDVATVALRRSETYFPYIDSVLVAHNLPWKLRYLAVLESMLRPKAVSHAGATGMWQFMPATGRMYGLKVNDEIDERNDYRKSTIAAADYLADLKDQFGDWFLAMAAYNNGPGNIRKHIRRSEGNHDYYKIWKRLPKETAEYIPKFVAIAYVMEYAPEYKLVPRRPDVDVPPFIAKRPLSITMNGTKVTSCINQENCIQKAKPSPKSFFEKIWDNCASWFSKDETKASDSVALN